MLPASALYLLGVFNSVDGGDMFLRNVEISPIFMTILIRIIIVARLFNFVLAVNMRNVIGLMSSSQTECCNF
jgi:hypothetical protein